ncbi:MAG: DUF1311 domain-containing protein, partial [Lachnospiraceae bacterium]|nr:DUF1311 domain-containing protein [Lachnospiraceae bacterium]
AAIYEKGVWEEELNKILDAYYTAKSVVAVESMQQDEQSFRAEREKLSQDVAKAADEALDGLAYNKEYIRLTKEKTYEYIDRYFTEE